MSVVRRHIADGAISPNKLAAALYDGSYFRYVGDHQPFCQDGNGIGVPSGIDTGVFVAGFRCGDLMGTYIGGPQTIINPYNLNPVTGLVISLDETDTFGVEYAPPGFITGIGPHAIDSDIKDGSFIRFKGSIDVVDGISALSVGFRGAGAVNPIYSLYDDLGALTVEAGGPVQEETNNAGAGVVQVNPSITFTDTEEFELAVVFKAGFFRFYVNGVEIGDRIAPESGITLVPFVHILQDTTTTAVRCKELEFGKLSDLNDEAEW